MRKAIPTILAAVAGLALTTGPADAVQLEKADREVSRVRVTYVEPARHGRLYVELNNGATYRLKPCRHEDSPSCYWDARSRGNGIGHSFATVDKVTTYTIPERLMRGAR